MGKAPTANRDKLPSLGDEEEDKEQIDDMQKRLEALKS